MELHLTVCLALKWGISHLSIEPSGFGSMNPGKAMSNQAGRAHTHVSISRQIGNDQLDMHPERGGGGVWKRIRVEHCASIRSAEPQPSVKPL